MLRTLKILTLPALLVALFLSVTAGERPADEPGMRTAQLLDAMVEAYGGRQALRAVTALRMEGRITTSQSMEGTVVRISRGPGSLASIVEYPGRAEIRILSGTQAWRGGSHDALENAPPAMHAAMQMQSARLLTPWILDQYRDRVELVEESASGALVRLELAPDQFLWARLDSSSRLVTWTASVFRMGELELEFTTRYADFRPVDGVLFPHREENTAQKVPTATLEFTSVSTNPEGEGLLLVPAGRIGGPGSEHPANG